MFSEIQMRVVPLLRLIAQQAQRRAIDPGDIEIPEGVVPGIPAALGPLVIDHIEFPEVTDPAAIPGGVVRSIDGPARFFRYGVYGGGGAGPGPDMVLLDGTQAKRTQLAVPLTVWVTPRSELGPAPGPHVTALPYVLIWLDVGVSAGASGSSPSIVFSIGDVGDELGLLDKFPAVKATLLAALVRIKLPPIALGASPLAALGIAVPILYGDVAPTADRQGLAMRFEMPTEGAADRPVSAGYGSAQIDKWIAFYAGKTESQLGETIDWSYSVETAILEHFLPEVINRNLHTDPVTKKVDWSKYPDGIDFLTEGPTVTFSGRATAKAHLALELKPCSGLMGENVWPHVDLTVTTTYDAAPRGSPPVPSLVATLDVARHVTNTWECEVAAGLVVGLSEAVILSFGGFAGLALGFVAGFFSTLYVLEDEIASTSSGLASDRCKQTKWPSIGSPAEQYECVYPLASDIFAPSDLLPGGAPKPGAIPIARLALAAVLDRPGTLSLGGTLGAGALLAAARLELDVASDPFAPSIEGLCGSAPTTSYSAQVGIKNAAAGAHLPLYLFGLEIRAEDDPANQYRPFLRMTHAGPTHTAGPEPEVPLVFPMAAEGKRISMRIPLWEVSPEFEAAPYDCVVTVRSTGGARRVRLPALVPLTAPEREEWAASMKIRRAAECPILYEPIWDLGSLKDHWWDGGDPPFGDPGVRVWEYGVGGLTPGEIVTLADDTHGVLSAGIATAGGVAYVTALTSARDHGRTIQLNRSVSGWSGLKLTPGAANGGANQASRGRDAAGRGLALRKSLFGLRAVVPLDAACLSLAGSSGPAGERLLLVVSSHGLEVLDVSTPRAPMAHLRLMRPGLAGAMSGGRGTALLWGDGGLELIRLSVAHPFALHAVAGAVASACVIAGPGGPGVAALRHGQIDLFASRGDRLEHTGTIAAPEAREVAAAGNTLVVRTDRGIECVHPVEPGAAANRAGHPVADARRLVVPRLLTGGPAVGLATATGGVMIDLADPHRPSELLRTPMSPWFADVALAGTVLAHVDGDRTSISLYEAEASVQELRTPGEGNRKARSCTCH